MPFELAGGISQALITTATGLSIAIPAMIANRYFERHVESLIVQLEGQATMLVDAMHSDLFKQLLSHEILIAAAELRQRYQPDAADRCGVPALDFLYGHHHIYS